MDNYRDKRFDRNNSSNRNDRGRSYNRNNETEGGRRPGQRGNRYGGKEDFGGNSEESDWCGTLSNPHSQCGFEGWTAMGAFSRAMVILSINT